MSDFMVVFVTCGSEDEALTDSDSTVGGGTPGSLRQHDLPAPLHVPKGGKDLRRKEWLVVIKTRLSRFEDLAKRVKALHSYSVPEIIALPIVEGSPAYLNWIEENTK